MEGGRPESAGQKGRVCEICYIDRRNFLPSDRHEESLVSNILSR